MKKWIDRGKISISLVAGYGLISLTFFATVMLLGYIASELIFRTIEEPTVPTIFADVIFVCILAFIFSRKRIRGAFADFWKQIKNNM